MLAVFSVLPKVLKVKEILAVGGIVGVKFLADKALEVLSVESEEHFVGYCQRLDVVGGKEFAGKDIQEIISASNSIEETQDEEIRSDDNSDLFDSFSNEELTYIMKQIDDSLTKDDDLLIEKISELLLKSVTDTENADISILNEILVKMDRYNETH